MFGGSTLTEYDEIVAKTTDENLTSENWELILNLCDKVSDEGQSGAHAAITAILKRLAHRNPTVQLYALSLTESLGKNLGIEIHREIASRAFIQGLEKLITDRNTHEKVRRRALGLIAEWTAEFESDSSLGVMEDCYNNLKAKNYKFEVSRESPPPTVDDEIRRKEEEELQRVLEMSMQDRGGRERWNEYSLATANGAGPSASNGGSGLDGSSAAAATGSAVEPSSTTSGYASPKYQGGYAPARTPSPERVAAQQRQQQLDYQKQLEARQRAEQEAKEQQAKEQQAKEQQAKEQQAKEQQAKEQQAKEQQAKEQQAKEQQAKEDQAKEPPARSTEIASSSNVVAPTPATAAAASTSAATNTPTPNINIVTRVRALYTFEPTEPGELSFEKGDIIKVVDRGYQDWWRGQIKGRTGIFPVNYVEPMPELTASELAKEAEQEAAVFAQVVNVEKLLTMLKTFDPAKDNLADDEEIQELYRSSMALRPKIVKLIDKYSQKRADLVSMNETFLRARTIFDRMMEDSLARHTGIYDQPTYRPPGHYGQGRPGSRNSMILGGPQPYGWRPGYDYDQHQIPPQRPTPQPGYNSYPGTAGPAPPFPVFTPQPLPTSATPVPVQSQPAQPGTYGAIPFQGLAQPQQHPQPQPPQSPVAATASFGIMPVGGYAGHQSSPPYSQQGPTPYPAQPQQEIQSQSQPQPAQPYQQPSQEPIQQPVQQHAQQLPIQHPIQQFDQQLPIQHPIQQFDQQPVQQSVQQPIQQSVQQPIQQPFQQSVQSVHQTFQQPAQQLVQQSVQHPNQLSPEGLDHQQPQLYPIQTEAIAQAQAQVVPEGTSTQSQTQSQEPQPLSEPQVQSQHPAQPITGHPPYPYDPSYTYADQNAQAWAQYYAQGGTDLAGSVYFISIPGVKEESSASTLQNQPPQQVQQQGGNVASQLPYLGSSQQSEPQDLSRSSSYQAQAQPHLQGFTQQSYLQGQVQGAGEASSAGPSAPSAVQQAHTKMPRYQLSDNPVPGNAPTQPQPIYEPQYVGPTRADGGDNISGHQPSSPTTSSLATTAPLKIKHAQSPAQTSTTPSWVLPKKANAPGFGSGPQGGSPPTGGPYYQAVGSS